MPIDQWDELFGGGTARELGNPDALAAHLRHELRDIIFTPDGTPMPARPVILAPEVRLDLVSATRTLVELVNRVCWSITDDPAELARLTRVRPDQNPLLGLQGDRHETELAAAIARPDVMLSNGCPIFLEANIGTVDGCVATSHFLLRAYRELFGLERELGPLDRYPEPFAGRVPLYRKVASRIGREPAVAVVGSLKETVLSRRYFEAEVHYLRERGIDAEFLEPDEFGDPRISRRFSLALRDFAPDEMAALGVDLTDVVKASRDMLFLAPDSAQSLSSKIVFAWLSEGLPSMTDADQQFVDRHIPWTRLVEHTEVSFEGTETNLVELILADPGQFLLKPLNSNSGYGVLAGSDCDPDEWRVAVEKAVLGRDHVVQRYVEADPLEMDFFDRRTGALHRCPVDYVFGPYVIDGVGAGCGVRHKPKASSTGIVNHSQGASINLAY